MKLTDKQPNVENVVRSTMPFASEELLAMVGFPPGARLLVHGKPIERVEVEWFRPAGAAPEPIRLPGERPTESQHTVTRPVIICPIASCEGRQVIGHGPFASHLRWHEKRGDEVPAEAYERAGIAEKDRGQAAAPAPEPEPELASSGVEDAFRKPARGRRRKTS